MFVENGKKNRQEHIFRRDPGSISQFFHLLYYKSIILVNQGKDMPEWVGCLRVNINI
jgi:hypothetical protein